MAQEPDPLASRHRPRLSPARRVGLLIIGVLSIGLSATCTVQIVRAVWFPERLMDDVECRSGVLSLNASVQRARERAAESPEGERAALAVFRSALQPEWDHQAGIRAACQQDPIALRALRTVELLRYAEERAVRYEALGLSPLRQRALALQQELDPAFESGQPSSERQ